MKNTEAVFYAWAASPEFEHLFLLRQANGFSNLKNCSFIHEPVPQKQFDQLFAMSMIHLCPSQYEGFGHYIWEAFSAGNLVITTDHDPMREFVDDSRLRVSGKVFKRQGYGRLYQADMKSLKKVVEYVRGLSNEEVLAIGKENRQKWVENDKFFRGMMKKLINHIR